MAFANPATERHTADVDTGLADALDRLLGALDEVPAKGASGRERAGVRTPQTLAPYRASAAEAQAREHLWPRALAWLQLLGVRLRRSKRLRYRAARLVLAFAVYAGVVLGILFLLMRGAPA